MKGLLNISFFSNLVLYSISDGVKSVSIGLSLSVSRLLISLFFPLNFIILSHIYSKKHHFHSLPSLHEPKHNYIQSLSMPAILLLDLQSRCSTTVYDAKEAFWKHIIHSSIASWEVKDILYAEHISNKNSLYSPHEQAKACMFWCGILRL